MNYMMTYKPTFDFEKVLENIFDRPNRRGSTEERNGFTPPADVYTTNDSYILEVELPGWEESDLEVILEDRILTLSTKKDIARDKGKRKNFMRTFVIPKDVDPESIQGKLSRGILTLTLHKRPEEKPRRIKIKAA